MPGFGEPERARGLAFQAGGDPAQIEPGDAEAAAGSVRIQPETEVVGVEGAGHVQAVDDLVRAVPAAGRQLLGGGDTGRVTEAVHLHVAVLGVRGAGLAVPEEHPHLAGRGGRERAKERLVGVVTPGRHLAQHVLDLPGRGRARRAHPSTAPSRTNHDELIQYASGVGENVRQHLDRAMKPAYAANVLRRGTPSRAPFRHDGRPFSDLPGRRAGPGRASSRPPGPGSRRGGPGSPGCSSGRGRGPGRGRRGGGCGPRPPTGRVRRR